MPTSHIVFTAMLPPLLVATDLVVGRLLCFHRSNCRWACLVPPISLSMAISRTSLTLSLHRSCCRCQCLVLPALLPAAMSRSSQILGLHRPCCRCQCLVLPALLPAAMSRSSPTLLPAAFLAADIDVPCLLPTLLLEDSSIAARLVADSLLRCHRPCCRWIC